MSAIRETKQCLLVPLQVWNEREREIKQKLEKWGGIVTNEEIRREEKGRRRIQHLLSHSAHALHVNSLWLHKSPVREESFALILETWKLGL